MKNDAHKSDNLDEMDNLLESQNAKTEEIICRILFKKLNSDKNLPIRGPNGISGEYYPTLREETIYEFYPHSSIVWGRRESYFMRAILH